MRLDRTSSARGPATKAPRRGLLRWLRFCGSWRPPPCYEQADGACNACRHKVHEGEQEHEAGHGEHEEIKPLVGAEAKPRGGEKFRRLGLGDDDALHAAGPLLKVVELEKLRHRDAEGEGREREVQALEPERRQPE